MPVTRLNHAVLYVRNVERSVAFYQEALDFHPVTQMKGAAFLQAPASNNDHDLALFEMGDNAGPTEAGTRTVGLYHLAWEVDTLEELERIRTKLVEMNSLVGQSDHGTTKALYAKDPDGIEFEVSWLVPADQLTPDLTITTKPLDLVAAKEKYGARTRGGVGISFPAKV